MTTVGKYIIYDTPAAAVLQPDRTGVYNQVICCPRCTTVFGPPIHDSKLRELVPSAGISKSAARYRRGAKGFNKYLTHLKSGCELTAGGVDIPVAALAAAVNRKADFSSATRSRGLEQKQKEEEQKVKDDEIQKGFEFGERMFNIIFADDMPMPMQELTIDDEIQIEKALEFAEEMYTIMFDDEPVADL